MEVTQGALRSSMRCGRKSTKSTNRMGKSSRNEGGEKTEMENEVEMTQGNGESGVGG